MPAHAQVLQHADVAFFFGMIDTQQRIDAMTMQLLISQLIADGTVLLADCYTRILNCGLDL